MENGKIKKLKIILAVIFLTAISLAGYFYLTKNQTPEAEAGWFDDNWTYRKQINVTNGSGSNLTDFQVKILDNKDLSADITAGKIQADLDDLRFTDISGNVLNYWIEDNTAASVDVWIKAPSVSTTGGIFFMYYGNAQATSAQNGNQVFEFFDDFSGTNIDTDKWTETDAGGEIVISNGPGNWGNTALFSNQIFARSNLDFHYKGRSTCTVGASETGYERRGGTI